MSIGVYHPLIQTLLAAETEQSGVAKLGINLPSLVAQLLNFIILLVLLYLFAYKPILKMLDKRSEKIKESMDQAEKIKLQTAQSEEQIRSQLEASRKEGQALIAQASQMGDKLKEEARKEARQEAEALIVKARSEIQREMGDATDALRREFADLAIKAAEKVINQSLNKDSHRKLIDDVLSQAKTLKG
ncbi:MAG: F0F1 ATP synthase subunit B [Dehalococcoidia bacterium]|nr:F0F1 ATP synthase subunit B [Dehalococcoidia bacterium]